MDLKQEERIYIEKESISFKKTSEKFGGLSNMASGYPIVLNGIFIKSSEALYQAMRFPDFPDIQREIISQNSPMTAKMISKKYRSHTRQDWDKIRVYVMKWTLRVKLLQNKSTFGKILLDTGNMNIVEESNKDQFWGAKRVNNEFLGMNILGRLLMELREQYKKYLFNEVSPLEIDKFLFFGEQILKLNEEDKLKHQYREGIFQ